jgi:hypothetical protein
MRKTTPGPGTLILGIETSWQKQPPRWWRRPPRALFRHRLTVADHRPYGGVVPEIAGRKHLENLFRLQSRSRSRVTPADLGAVAVTSSPGLMGPPGWHFLAKRWRWVRRASVEVNHVHAHALAIGLRRRPRLPYLALVLRWPHDVFSRLSAWIWRFLADATTQRGMHRRWQNSRLDYRGPEIDRPRRREARRCISRAAGAGSTLDFSFSA